MKTIFCILLLLLAGFVFSSCSDNIELTIVESPNTDLSNTNPPIIDLPSTELPTTEPPYTELPPITEPTVTEPPIIEPPIVQPPVTSPPITEPPAVELPITDPPSIELPPQGTPIDFIYPFRDGNFFFTADDTFRTQMVFRFFEGAANHGWWGWNYVAYDIDIRMNEFVDIMNSISNTLVGTYSRLTGQTFAGHAELYGASALYSFQMFEIRLENLYFFRMTFYQLNDYVYLSFIIHNWDAILEIGEGGRQYRQTFYSVYRVSRNDSSRIIDFAESLERYRQEWETG